MKNLIFIIILCLISGCAANIKHSVKTSNVQQSTMLNSITLDIVTSETVSNRKGLAKSIVELNELITNGYEGNLMPNSSPDQADILVEIRVEHFRYVSGFGRFMAGAFAGKAELKLSVRLIDLATNQIVNESQLDTRSKFSEGIFGPTTSRQLEAMSKKIISIINSSAKNS